MEHGRIYKVSDKSILPADAFTLALIRSIVVTYKAKSSLFNDECLRLKDFRDLENIANNLINLSFLLLGILESDLRHSISSSSNNATNKGRLDIIRT